MINRIGMGYGAAGFAAGDNKPAFKGNFLKKFVKKFGIGLTEAEKAAKKAKKEAFNKSFEEIYEKTRDTTNKCHKNPSNIMNIVRKHNGGDISDIIG